MAIDTRAKREVALLGPWAGMLHPDGALGSSDRAHMLEHYFAGGDSALYCYSAALAAVAKSAAALSAVAKSTATIEGC